MTRLVKRRQLLTQSMAAAAAMVTLSSARAIGSEQTTTGVTHQVEITRFKFKPDNLSVKPGDTIVWTNKDIAPHTATGNDESWDTGEIVRNGSKSILVVSGMQTGYFCRFHPNMKASLQIEDS